MSDLHFTLRPQDTGTSHLFPVLVAIFGSFFYRHGNIVTCINFK